MVHATHEQVVAIGWRLGRHAGTHGAARAAAVVDHQRLARGFGKLRSQWARKGIRAAARGERHHHVDRFGRPAAGALRPGTARGQRQARSAGCAQHVTALQRGGGDLAQVLSLSHGVVSCLSVVKRVGWQVLRRGAPARPRPPRAAGREHTRPAAPAGAEAARRQSRHRLSISPDTGTRPCASRPWCLSMRLRSYR